MLMRDTKFLKQLELTRNQIFCRLSLPEDHGRLFTVIPVLLRFRIPDQGGSRRDQGVRVLDILGIDRKSEILKESSSILTP
jgi:hypothetical protein